MRQRASAICEKLAALKDLDKQLQVFGAALHGYAFGPRASEVVLREAEERLDALLPEELRCFYASVGDGGAGPHYGLRPLRGLVAYRCAEPFMGIERLADEVRRRGGSVDENGYFEAEEDLVTGLIGIVDEGCGHTNCVVAAGESAGAVVVYTADRFLAVVAPSFFDYYECWLDQHLAQLRLVRELMDSTAPMGEIDERLRAIGGPSSAGHYIASLANVKKPESLFGTPGHRISHGATQRPWYERVLADWRRSK